MAYLCLVLRHYNIPVFLPELACPFRCVFCNQSSITGRHQLPDAQEVVATIEKHLHSFPEPERQVEIAFFGGNFTGLPAKTQQQYLELAQPYLQSKQVQGIRLSTRPDYVHRENLDLLASYGVSTIELGAQSTDDEVLRLSGRGHTAAKTWQASKMILDAGFQLGLQMMLGLPGDNPEKALQTAHDIIAWGATETRIYPCVVIRETELEKMFTTKTYQPLTLDEAISQAANIYLLFEQAKVKVLRLGLHASEELNGTELVAGPYHPNFAEMVFSRLWRQQFEVKRDWPKGKQIRILTAPDQRNFAIGFQATNKEMLEQRYQKVQFISDPALQNRSFLVQATAK